MIFFFPAIFFFLLLAILFYLVFILQIIFFLHVFLPLKISFYINHIDHVTHMRHGFSVGFDEFCCVFPIYFPAHVYYSLENETPAAAAKLSS